MPEESRTRRLAILIDADNTSPRVAAGLFEEVAKFGEDVVADRARTVAARVVGQPPAVARPDQMVGDDDGAGHTRVLLESKKKS